MILSNFSFRFVVSVGREPNGIYFRSGTAQAVRSARRFAAILPGGLRRSANKSPADESKAGGIGREPFGRIAD